MSLARWGKWSEKISVKTASNYTTQKGPRRMLMKIQFLVWERHKNMTGLNWWLGSNPHPLDNWISNWNT